jgi:hypothetical protein
MRNKISLNFVDRKITIPRKEICNRKNITKAKKLVANNIPEVLEKIPDGHPWKERKEKHMKMTEKETHQILEEYFSEKLTDSMIELADFISNIHDLGRYLQAQKMVGNFDKEKYGDFSNHGEAGINLIEYYDLLEPFSEKVAEIIKYSVLHHSEKDTKKLPEKPNTQEKLKYFYLSIVRDFDKFDNFARKVDHYVASKEARRKQIDAHDFLEQEQGKIKPSKLLKNFQKQQTLIKDEVRSFEAFMLQFLAWIFDINLEVVLKETVACGGPEKLLNYLNKQLPKEQYQPIKKTCQDFIKNKL